MTTSVKRQRSESHRCFGVTMYEKCRVPPLRIQWGLIPKGYRGTMETLRHIARLIREGARDFCVRRAAIQVFRAYDIAPKDGVGEIHALFDWVKSNIRYTRDIVRVELLHSARRLLQVRAGDCDDMTILLSALLEATGHPVRLVIIGRDPRRPRLFSHIYLQTFHAGRWIALDPTMNRPMGWEPLAPVRKVFAIR